MVSRTATTFPPPVMEARRWLDGVEFSDRPLINVSQAAPVDPPTLAMREAMARMVVEDDTTHLYGPVLGLPELRAEVAAQWSQAYGGTITPHNVAITSGCNQAFAAAIATLCGEGDEVILPVPYYFNHRMWLDMAGVTTVPLAAPNGLIPSAEDAAALITDKTSAIALVTPNNPGGVEYPAETVQAFADLARGRGIALIIDETYRDFDSRTGAPHPLFGDPNWDDTLIQLYSFSKAYRLTGHRVGALIASSERLAEVEKFLDTVTICPNQLGQHAALWGMRNLRDWLAGERGDAYFAYLKHPFDMASDSLAQDLVKQAGVLTLPGTMFMPDNGGQQHLRIAFANVDRAGITALFDSLVAYQP
jgi:aspartate/methionine/tyrosine aminotransferase